MDFIATTGAFLGTTIVRDPDGTPIQEFSNFWDRRIGPLLVRERHVDQRPIVLALGDIRLEKPLGEGSFGQAWTCTVARAGRFVVKFPVEAAVVPDKEGWDTIPPADGKRSFSEQNIGAFQLEFTNFERMMEPHVAGAAASGAKYREYMEEMLRIKATPGYAHMHPLYHIAVLDTLPLIFSMPCEGSLYDYFEKLRLRNDRSLRPKRDGTPSDLWLRLALQLVLAMGFMEARDFVSVDIKAENILYRTHPMHFMIADYGMCTAASFKPCDHPRGGARVQRETSPYCLHPHLIASGALSKCQIAYVLEHSVDLSELTEGKPFSRTLEHRPIPATPYFETVHSIKTAVGNESIALCFESLARALQADGILP